MPFLEGTIGLPSWLFFKEKLTAFPLILTLITFLASRLEKSTPSGKEPLVLTVITDAFAFVFAWAMPVLTGLTRTADIEAKATNRQNFFLFILRTSFFLFNYEKKFI